MKKNAYTSFNLYDEISSQKQVKKKKKNLLWHLGKFSLHKYSFIQDRNKSWLVSLWFCSFLVIFSFILCHHPKWFLYNKHWIKSIKDFHYKSFCLCPFDMPTLKLVRTSPTSHYQNVNGIQFSFILTFY